jgi:hypothetical protein
MGILIAKGGEYALIGVKPVFPVHKASQAPGCLSPPGGTLSCKKAGKSVEVALFF